MDNIYNKIEKYVQEQIKDFGVVIKPEKLPVMIERDQVFAWDTRSNEAFIIDDNYNIRLMMYSDIYVFYISNKYIGTCSQCGKNLCQAGITNRKPCSPLL